MQLEKIDVSKIYVTKDFNVRKNFGDSETLDLQESLQRTDGNVEPLIVNQTSAQNIDSYELISGERRLRALAATKIPQALCIVYKDLSDVEKTKLMLHENLGRKNLTFQEEIKALKRLKELGEILTVKTVAASNAIHEKTAWRLLKALEAVEEFPELEVEKTRNDVLKKYKKLKGGLNEQFDKVDKAIESNKLVIDELKEEIAHYKTNPGIVAKAMTSEDRFKQGILIKEDVQKFIKSARICETFGMYSDTDVTCVQCKKEAEKENALCQLYNIYFEKD